jgi:hypothetical protein
MYFGSLVGEYYFCNITHVAKKVRSFIILHTFQHRKRINTHPAVCYEYTTLRTGGKKVAKYHNFIKLMLITTLLYTYVC